MDTTKFGESQFVNAELVEQSPTKRVYIKTEGTVEQNSYGNDQMVLLVEMDNKPKQWSLSMDHVKTLQSAYGKDSKIWVGRNVRLTVINVNGKKRVTAIIDEPVQEVVK